MVENWEEKRFNPLIKEYATKKYNRIKFDSKRDNRVYNMTWFRMKSSYYIIYYGFKRKKT